MREPNHAISSSTPKTKEAWLKEAIGHYEAMRYEEVLLACEQAIALDPTFARAHHGKGLSLTRLHKYTDALSSYEKARQLAPDKAKIYADLAELVMLLHEDEEARENYKQAFKLDGRYKDAYVAAMKPLARPLIEPTANAPARRNYTEHELFYTSKGYFYSSEMALEELREEHPDIFRR